MHKTESVTITGEETVAMVDVEKVSMESESIENANAQSASAQNAWVKSICLETSPHAQKAMKLFKEGFNCAQSVFLAFEEECGLERSVALKLSSSFGGGMGRLREVCGAVSGMFMVAGVLYGYDSPEDYEAKASHYERIQELARRFTAETGSIVCRDLLGLSQKSDAPTPEKRTEAYYQKRPCEQMVGLAAVIMERYMEENDMQEK